MGLMDSVTRGRTAQPPRLLVYGVEGVGKSSWAASAPSPIFISTEDGLSEIDTAKMPLCTDFDMVVRQLGAVLAEDHDFRTLCVDSLDWLERLIWDAVCAEYGAKNIERVDGGYGHGYVIALTYWRRVIALLDRIRAERRMGVILIAHSKVETFQDPENGPYDRYSPRLYKSACALVSEWVDAVLFASHRIRVGDGKAAPVGAGGGERRLRTAGSPACVAKNRYGLPDEIPLSWDAFAAALRKEPANGR